MPCAQYALAQFERIVTEVWCRNNRVAVSVHYIFFSNRHPFRGAISTSLLTVSQIQLFVENANLLGLDTQKS